MKAITDSSTDGIRGVGRALRAALRAAGLLLVLTGPLLAAPPALAALPAAPTVAEPALSQITTTSTSFSATLDPHLKPTHYAFQYITRSDWQADGEQFGNGTQTAAEGELTEGLEEPHRLGAAITGLDPAGGYRVRLLAKSVKGEAEASLPFYTYATPLAGLPDGRAYEQVSPVDKDGGDVGGFQAFVKAASGGEGAIFGSSSGIPGGTGAQEFPFYVAMRSPDGWLSSGLLPPAQLGPKAKVIGWSPDFSRFYQTVTTLGEFQANALYERAGTGEETQLAPYQRGATYAYAGSSADDGIAVFESSAGNLDTTKAGAEGESNVYAWDGSRFHLVSILPGGAVAAHGAFAGPYDWAEGRTTSGGAAAQYYDQEERAVSADGSVFFTTAGDGHLYQRRDPTAKTEDCASATAACTLDVSASHRTPPDPAGRAPAAFQAASADGDTAFFTSSEELTDDAHTGPAVEGPKIGRVTIGPAPEEEAEEELPELLTDHHAVGIAVSDGYVYWADPLGHAIGRAKLDGSNTPTEVEDPFIELGGEEGETCAETHPGTEPGAEQCEPSTPRYVAVGPCAEGGECLYWTNTGPLGGDQWVGEWVAEHRVAGGAGTIGRAALDGSGALVPGSVEPEFITGASNPQGIAVNSEHVYWANAGERTISPDSEQCIARAAIDGEHNSVEQCFFAGGILTGGKYYPNTYLLNPPAGMALNGGYLYWTDNSHGSDGSTSYADRIPVEGSEEEPEGILTSHVSNDKEGGNEARGIAIIGSHLYWSQKSGVIGRTLLSDFDFTVSGCSEISTCEPEYLRPGGSLGGLAADPSGEHLYWSANGEVPPHPGSDLYRYQAEGAGGCAEAGGCLTDLTPDPADEDGAEVKGVLGASDDGSHLYFVANAVLAHNTVDDGAGPEEAEPGNCDGFTTPGGGEEERGDRCNLYLWEAAGGPAGTISFLARLEINGALEGESDGADWVPRYQVGGIGGQNEKTSQTSADGRSLLFRSRRRLTAYQNEGTPELYLYRDGVGISCVSCDPTLAPPSGTPQLGNVNVVTLRASNPAAVASRNLSASGGRVLFQTTDPLSVTDQNGVAGCPSVGHMPGGNSLQFNYFSCLDVYEWEAPGEGTCAQGGDGYSPADGGCLFLISTGKGDGYPALLTDASTTGGDVFFFDREGLVGQDTDRLLDLYDARVGGGIASQSPPRPNPCEGEEACRSGASPAPTPTSPVTPGVTGPGNVKPERRRCPRGTHVRKKGGKHGRKVCVRRPRRHSRHHHKRGKHGHDARRTHR